MKSNNECFKEFTGRVSSEKSDKKRQSGYVKRTDYVINLLVNLVSSYSELKTLLALLS